MKKKYKLGDVCEVKSGNSKFTLDYAKKNPGIYPVYGKSGFMIPRCFINDFEYCGNYIFFLSSSSRKFVGTFFYLEKQKFSIDPNARVLKNFKFKLNLKYLYFYFCQINIKKYIVGGRDAQIRIQESYDIDIFLPSLNTQNYFVKRLWFLEESFNELKKLKIQLQDIKRKLLRYCFGKYLDDEKDLRCKLKKVCVIKLGNSKLTKKYCETIKGPYPVYSSKTTNDHIHAYIKKFDYYGKYIWFTNHGFYAGSFYYENNKKFSINADATILIKKETKTNLNLKYIYYYLLFKQRKIKHVLTVGAAIKRINVDDISQYLIQIPSLSTQSKIIQFLSSFEFIDPIILKIDNFLNTYNTNKKTLLQILFNLIK